MLVADSGTESREFLIGLLQMESDFYVKGDARDGREVIDLVRSLSPDVLIVDRNISGMDIAAVVEEVHLSFPGTGIIVVLQDLEPETLGDLLPFIQGYLVKPVNRGNLAVKVRKVYEITQKDKMIRAASPSDEPSTGEIVTVYSPQGGSGKSMLACNLAVALSVQSKQNVVLIDLNLQFGDIDLMLNLTPDNTIVGLAQKQHSGELEPDVVEHYLTKHDETGLKVLVAPATPEHAETITLYTVSQTLEALQQNYQYIVVDTPSQMLDTTFAALDVSSSILMITTLDLLALHKTKTALERLQKLYPGDKIKLVLNRANSQVGISHQQVEAHLGLPISSFIPSDGHIVVRSVNEGRPFVLSDPDSPIAHRVTAIAYEVMGKPVPSNLGANGKKPGRSTTSGGILQWILGTGGGKG